MTNVASAEGSATPHAIAPTATAGPSRNGSEAGIEPTASVDDGGRASATASSASPSRSSASGPVLILGGLVVAMTLLSPVFLTTGTSATSSPRPPSSPCSPSASCSSSSPAASTCRSARTWRWHRSSARSSSQDGAVGVRRDRRDARRRCRGRASSTAPCYVWGRLPHPFIITLATLSIARGLALQFSGGQPDAGHARGRADHRQRVGRAGSRTRPSSSAASPSLSPSCCPGWCGDAGSTPSAATRRRRAAPASRCGRCSSRSTCCAACSPASPRSSPRGGSTPGSPTAGQPRRARLDRGGDHRRRQLPRWPGQRRPTRSSAR